MSTPSSSRRAYIHMKLGTRSLPTRSINGSQEGGMPRVICALCMTGSIDRTAATKQGGIATRVQQMCAISRATGSDPTAIVQHAAYGATVHLHAHDDRSPRRASPRGEDARGRGGHDPHGAPDRGPALAVERHVTRSP